MLTLRPETVDERFKELVEDLDLKVIPESRRITVLIHFPHLARFGHEPTRELTYGCRFKVEVGDRVLCPPTPWLNEWTIGIVQALHGNGYSGRVKYVHPYEETGAGE